MIKQLRHHHCCSICDLSSCDTKWYQHTQRPEHQACQNRGSSGNTCLLMSKAHLEEHTRFYSNIYNHHYTFKNSDTKYSTIPFIQKQNIFRSSKHFTVSKTCSVVCDYWIKITHTPFKSLRSLRYFNVFDRKLHFIDKSAFLVNYY